MKTFRSFTEEKTKKPDYDIDDLSPVQYSSLDDKFSKRNAKKKKVSLEGTFSDEMNSVIEALNLHELDDEENEELIEFMESLDDMPLIEVLNVAQRRKRGIIAKRNKAKLKRGRQKASRRIADKDRIAGRAKRQARGDLVKKLTKGVSKADLSPQRKAEIERRLQKMSGRIARGQRRLLPSVRKRDRGL